MMAESFYTIIILIVFFFFNLILSPVFCGPCQARAPWSRPNSPPLAVPLASSQLNPHPVLRVFSFLFFDVVWRGRGNQHACSVPVFVQCRPTQTYQAYFFFFFPLSWEGQRSNALIGLLRLSPVSACWLCFTVVAGKITQLTNQLKHLFFFKYMCRHCYIEHHPYSLGVAHQERGGRRFLVDLYCLFSSSYKNKEQKTFPSGRHFYRLLVFRRRDEKGGKRVVQGWRRRRQQLFHTETNLRPQRWRDRSESEVTLEMWAWPDIQRHSAVITEIYLPPSHLLAFGSGDPPLHRTSSALCWTAGKKNDLCNQSESLQHYCQYAAKYLADLNRCSFYSDKVTLKK